jgi:AraC-like DNA-binding protein
MKALSFKIPKTGETSFNVQVDEVPHFYDRLHLHPELQITLIQKSHGTLFVGDSISTFKAGDLFIIGPNIPHALKNDASFYNNENFNAKSISIFFSKEAFGDSFFQLPELFKINDFLNNAEKGLRVLGENNDIKEKVVKIVKQKGFNRLLLLFSILQDLANHKQMENLSRISFSAKSNELQSEKISRIFQFIMDNYHRPIKLEEAAEIANLSVSAFCRYFKLRTRSTFSRFLNEIRVSTACKQLIGSEYSVSEVCYQVGFNNISNFNRQFKIITGFTPSQYLSKHRN